MSLVFEAFSFDGAYRRWPIVVKTAGIFCRIKLNSNEEERVRDYLGNDAYLGSRYQYKLT